MIRKLLLLLGMCIILSSIVLADGNYTFTNGSGTFYVVNWTTVANTTWTAPVGVTNFKVLIVAGGGGASNSHSGGGGGGGLIYNTSYTVTAGQVYNISVGAGGSLSAGKNSSFGTNTANGGGIGGLLNNNGGNGGSGGGTGRDGGASVGGTATPAGQGYNGGKENAAGSYRSGGGGGGAGAVGYDGGYDLSARGGGSTESNGGAGKTYSITGSDVCYAGGGAGTWYVGANYPTGGCGGGNSGYNACTVAGTDGTNGTGGGAGGDCAGGNKKGGSGVVVIQYQIVIPYSIKGNLTYSGTAISAANVLLINPTTNAILSNATSNSTGGYTFSSLTNNTLYLVHAFKTNATVNYTKSIYVNVTVQD
jgi:hypothetical protein